MDTKISLLDGRELSIRDIEKELSDDKELWTYSAEPKTGKVVPGLISWAGVTQKSAKVMKITMDNGEEIICTPDHKFVQYETEYKRAQDFKVGDSLVPLYRRKEPQKNKLNKYEELFDNKSKEWIYTHRLVADAFKESLCERYDYTPESTNKKYNLRHHKDYNRHNNAPNNLCWMSWGDHHKLHKELGFSREAQQLGTNAAQERLSIMKENDPAGYKEYCQAIAERLTKWHAKMSMTEKETWNYKQRHGINHYFETLSDDALATRIDISKNNIKNASKIKLEKMQSDPKYYKWVCEQQSKGWTDELKAIRSKTTSERNYKLWHNNTERKKRHSDLQTVTYTHDMLLKVIDLIKNKTTHEMTCEMVKNELNCNKLFVKDLKLINKDKKVKNWNPDLGFTSTGIKSMVKQFGYASWGDFRKKEIMHNHRIVRIEYLDEEIEVGTLTIDQNEIHNNYHTFALSAGVFVYNSNLGEINDLQYFNNKLVRGLRIPSSYLPTGPEEGERTYNDGKVGTALIQEWRFNQYCIRLQGLMSQKLDKEFKMFLNWRGINIDNSIFDLRLNEPQNFASYSQAEVDSTRMATFSQVADLPYISKRFALKRYMGMTEEEMAENTRLWEEEQGEVDANAGDDAGGDLRAAGVSPGGIEGDMESFDELEGAVDDIDVGGDLDAGGIDEPSPTPEI